MCLVRYKFIRQDSICIIWAFMEWNFIYTCKINKEHNMIPLRRFLPIFIFLIVIFLHQLNQRLKMKKKTKACIIHCRVTAFSLKFPSLCFQIFIFLRWTNDVWFMTKQNSHGKANFFHIFKSFTISLHILNTSIHVHFIDIHPNVKKEWNNFNQHKIITTNQTNKIILLNIKMIQNNDCFRNCRI